MRFVFVGVFSIRGFSPVIFVDSDAVCNCKCFFDRGFSPVIFVDLNVIRV
jgi:hypothetical protein